MNILNSVFSYLDLNSDPESKSALDTPVLQKMEVPLMTAETLTERNEVLSGDLLKEMNIPKPQQVEKIAPAKTKASVKWWYLIVQYIALVLGIVIQPSFASYQATKIWNFEGFWGWLLFSAIVGIALLPNVYSYSYKRGKPLPVQLCVLFVAGLGWESLLRTTISAVGK